MAKSTYFSPSRVKPFLLHQDGLIRRHVAAYLRESLSQDRELVPLVARGCNNYGETANFAGLEAARHFRLSYPSVTIVLGLLERAEHETSVCALNNILAAMSAPIFFLSQGKLMRAPRVFPSTLNRLYQRLDIWNRSPAWLASNFARFIEEAPHEDELVPGGTQRTLVDDLVDALVPFEEPSSRFLIERLAHCSSHRDGGAPFVADLLGKRRVRTSIPALIECFTMDSDHLSCHAAEALIRIGDEGAIELLRERTPQGSASFKRQSMRTLIGFKHLESELLLLDLLELEEDPLLRALYCEGLCCHYAIRGHRLIRRQIGLSKPEVARRLKIGLLVTSIVRGGDLPEAGTWREEILDIHKPSEAMLFEPALEET